MKNILFLFLVLVLSINCLSVKSQYNLDFENSDINKFNWKLQNIYDLSIDSSILVNGKYPLCIQPQKQRFGEQDLLLDPVITFSQIIPLPDEISDKDSISISVHTKCNNMVSLKLQVVCYDSENNISYADSLDLNNNNNWTTKRLKLKSDNYSNLLIGFRGLISLNVSDSSKFWIDRVSLFVNGKSLDKNSCFSSRLTYPILKSEYIKPLLKDNNQSFESIEAFKKKRIIGIGESIHGSRTINSVELQLLKYLITNQGCKLVLFEMDLYALFFYNLYIQGLINEESINDIKIDLYSNLYDAELLSDFFTWLRDYNLKNNDKVTIRGVFDFNYNSFNNYLFDYVYSFYQIKTYPELRSILIDLNKLNFLEALNKIKANQNLSFIFGLREYNDLIYILQKLNNNSQSNQIIDSVDRIEKRDSLMWNNVEQFIANYESMSDKIAIVAHYNHINTKIGDFPYLRPLGFFLRNKYKEDYYSIGIFVGNGYISNRDSLGFSKVILENALPESLEDVCLKTLESYFFYSTKDLYNNSFLYRNIGAKYIIGQGYETNLLKQNVDAFLFTDKSEGFLYDSIANVYSTYKINKIILRAEIMKKLY